MKGKHMRQQGQMTVELAVCLPVFLIALVISIDMGVYFSEIAAFDHLFAQTVLSQGVTQSGGAYSSETVQSSIDQELENYFFAEWEDVSVTVEETGTLNDLMLFKGVLKVSPWPLSTNKRQFMGMNIPLQLTHEKAFVVKPYIPGKL